LIRHHQSLHEDLLLNTYPRIREIALFACTSKTLQVTQLNRYQSRVAGIGTDVLLCAYPSVDEEERTPHTKTQTAGVNR
jgi:hypothetical protein